MLIQTINRFMFGNDAPPLLQANRITKTQIWAIDAAYQRMPATLDDLDSKHFNEYIKNAIKDETSSTTDERPCYIISMNGSKDSFLPEITKRILHIYTVASFRPNREQDRIDIANKLARIEPTTALYRHYLLSILNKLPSEPDELSDLDWLLLSSTTLINLFDQHTDRPHWANTITWTEHVNSRFDLTSKDLNNLLDPINQKFSRTKLIPNSWYVSENRIRIRLEVDSFKRPYFDSKALPGSLMIPGESKSTELVLDRKETQAFLNRDFSTSRWHSIFKKLRTTRGQS